MHHSEKMKFSHLCRSGTVVHVMVDSNYIRNRVLVRLYHKVTHKNGSRNHLNPIQFLCTTSSCKLPRTIVMVKGKIIKI